MLKKILIKGAKEHNLKNISLEVPKDKLVVLVKNKNSRSCKKMIGHVQKIFSQFKTIKH